MKILKEHPIFHGTAIGLIPARGGSKTVELKNIAPLAGRPLISYCISSAKRVTPKILSRVLCSTDHPRIQATCNEFSIEVILRPEALSTDTARVEDAVKHVLQHEVETYGGMPEIVVLLQPTSPFVRPVDIERVVTELRLHPELDTCQTISLLPHNSHAYNQRLFENGRVEFRFQEERARAYNKALKPQFYKFGNLVAFRSVSILAGNACFGPNSGGIIIDELSSIDVDGPDDFLFAEYVLERGLVVPQ